MFCPSLDLERFYLRMIDIMKEEKKNRAIASLFI